MQRIRGDLILSATDLTKHLACPHVTTLDREVVDGVRPAPPQGIDEQLELIFRKGLEHEEAFRRDLERRGLTVVEISNPDRVIAEQQTVAAMRAGVDVVYQGTLYDGSWIGYADFLLRNDHQPSAFGSWSYDIADTKLARRLKVPALLQMATYAERLEALQGVAPASLVVVAGDKQEHWWRLIDAAAYARRVRSSLRTALDQLPLTEGVPTPYCSQCRWRETCETQWAAADDLCLVAGMRVRHRKALLETGISSLTALATAEPEALAILSGAVRTRLLRQARLQLRERQTGVPAYELLPPEPGRGLLRLPEPDPGDLYLDFEGDPFAADGRGREYLAGLLNRDGEFVEWWAHDAEAEKGLTEGLLTHLVEHWRAHPGMHVYHYAPYEQTALKRLAGQYGVAESELDQLLRGERFVDLYAVVKQGLVISKGSYSIKKLEDFYWGHVRHGEGEEVADAMSSVVEYERWLDTGDQHILDRIRDYNIDDVRSTLALHDWLEARRDELATLVSTQQIPGLPFLGVLGAGAPSAGADGAVRLPRPGEHAFEDAADPESAAAEARLAARLEDAGQELFAGLVGWHRREDRPQWWDFFRRADMSDADLVDDLATLGSLGPPEQVGELLGPKTGRVTSLIWRYRFPPQDCTLTVGTVVHDVDEPRDGCGTVVSIDAAGGWIDVSRGVKKEPAAVRGMGPPGPVNSTVLRESVSRSAERLLLGEPTVAEALITRRVPAELRRIGEEPADAVVRVGRALDREVLAVQGPPGAGKTYAGAHLIRALLEDGKTVGVTAQSHAVIRNLLREIDRPALHKAGKPAEGEPACDGLVEIAPDNAAVVNALDTGAHRLIGGTAWLWSREELADRLDVLVIDEAGQFSLANAVAVAQAARAVVLLGDPQQLTQPTQAPHPFGAGVSALGHLIGDDPVIAPDRGLFLDRTWRMHPALTAVVSEISYDGQLSSAPGRQHQRIQARGRLTGAGVRWVPVPHEGNASDSPQEAAVVVDLVDDLLGGRWTDHEQVRHDLTEHDVLVVAPYNAHVARLQGELRRRGRDAVRVGTVDKFQGQQAPVVIYAMGSSSAADAPRGVEFLYDVHRLNVAISRARALAVIVGSPALLDAAVHHPEQLRQVNALCHYVERATAARRRPSQGRVAS